MKMVGASAAALDPDSAVNGGSSEQVSDDPSTAAGRDKVAIGQAIYQGMPVEEAVVRYGVLSDTARECLRAIRVWPDGVPPGGLSFEVLRVLASRDDRVELAQRVLAEGWTRAELLRQIVLLDGASRTMTAKAKRMGGTAFAYLTDIECGADVRADVRRRFEEAETLTRNQQTARRAVEEIDKRANQKLRAGDQAAARGTGGNPIEHVGDVLERLRATAVLCSSLLLKVDRVPYYTKDPLAHELRQVLKYAGLCLEGLTGEKPVLEGSALVEMLALVVETGPGNSVHGVRVVDDDDDVAEGELLN